MTDNFEYVRDSLIYSGIIPIASYLFIPVIGTFVVLLILRNVAIIYAEFIWKKVDNKPLMMFYSGATFLMVIGFVTAIAALLVGNSVSTAIPSLPPLLHYHKQQEYYSTYDAKPEVCYLH